MATTRILGATIIFSETRPQAVPVPVDIPIGGRNDQEKMPLLRSVRREIGFALAVNALIVVADLVAAPIHSAGRGQAVLGYFLGGTHILNMPGWTVGDWLGLRPQHRWTWPGFWVALPVNLVFWFAVGVGAARLRRRVLSITLFSRDPKGTAQTPPAAVVTEPLVSRRNLLLGGSRAVGAAGMGVGAWGFFGEARWFEVTRRDFPVRNLPRELDGLRVVQLSDIHHGQWMSMEWVRRILDVAQSLNPDVVALTGDYVYRGLEYVRPMAREFARLRPRIGIFGVMGNHDWWDGGGELTKRAYAEARVPLIDNARAFITPDRRVVQAPPAEGLCVAGVGDLWEDKCLYQQALGGVPGGMPRLLLSHNPDVAEEPEFVESGLRVDLMLSGHTHGGQVALPVIGSPVTNSHFGQKYARGLVRGPVCPVYVSRGLGMTVMPVRLGARPEIAVIDLRVG
jgi:predicted MPP superfamily phosphohydrolase